MTYSEDFRECAITECVIREVECIDKGVYEKTNPNSVCISYFRGINNKLNTSAENR